MKTIAVDFDGVIHSYTSGWKGLTSIPDPPVDGAFEFLRQAIAVYQVVVFSTRAENALAIRAMQDWFQRHGFDQFDQLIITNVKPKAGIYLDDRGWRFEGTFPSLEEIETFRPWNRKS